MRSSYNWFKDLMQKVLSGVFPHLHQSSLLGPAPPLSKSTTLSGLGQLPSLKLTNTSNIRTMKCPIRLGGIIGCKICAQQMWNYWTFMKEDKYKDKQVELSSAKLSSLSWVELNWFELSLSLAITPLNLNLILI